MLRAIEEKIQNNSPISREEATWLFTNTPDQDLQRLGSLVRAKYHKPNEATYLIMAIINFTNICVAKCDFCAFYRLPHQSGTYLLSVEQIKERIDALLQQGGTMVGFNSGFHPKLTIEEYVKFFEELHAHYPDLVFYSMTVAEFMFTCKLSKISYEEGAKIFKAAGIKWITGGGAEVLDEAFRKRHSPGKYTVEDYYKAQRAVLNEGIGSTATMVIGFDETLDERMNHLESLRAFQDESRSRSLVSFLCWTYKPWHTALGGTEISTQEYLRWLAVCRIYLHNIPHIRTSVLTKNKDALLGLSYGANDFDLPTEDEVTTKAGATISTNFEDILNKAREIGFEPIHRAPFGNMAEEAPCT